MEQATQKQIEFAKKLGIKTPEKYDKQALRGLIDVKLKEGHNPDGAVQYPILLGKESENGSKQAKGYHLTDEQIRTNALEAAQRWYPVLLGDLKEIEQFWNCVHEFEKYITG